MTQSSPRSLTAAQEPLVATLQRSIKSKLGLDLREVQLQAARQLLSRSLVEMQTGEGKTLTIAVAASLLSSQGRSVMVATANDYLANRDAQWMRAVIASAGLSVSFVDPSANHDQRRSAYRSNIVYGTIQQFAFDFLRDLMALRENSNHNVLIRKLDTLIIDEADSILIDEARTPLVIHAAEERVDPGTTACFRWAAEAAEQYTEDDVASTPPDGAVALTEQGRAKLLRLAMPATMNSLTMTDIQHALERAILVNRTMFRDHHYLVHDGRVAIVDEYTGRLSIDRTFGGGIHQAIEAREQIALTPMSRPIARITVQEFVSKFHHLCGVTATASEDQEELRRVYGFQVSKVPVYLLCQRILLDPVVCASQEEKRRQIAGEVHHLLSQHRPVLIGTRTIEQSEAISRTLTNEAIEHVVLSARHHDREAEIVAQAGTPGQVTVATNMAGRGTDIPLAPAVRDAGGLHVIVAEMNTAARIDAQLIGRCARQGDPGTARIYVAPDDKIFELSFGRQFPTQPVGNETQLIRRAHRAQKRIQREHQRQRNRLTAHESSLAASLRQLGLDPYLDQPASW